MKSGVRDLRALSIRDATAADAGSLAQLIHEFAAFERLKAEIRAEDVVRDGFGEQPRFRALIAEWEKRAAGYALFFDYYSTFRGSGGTFLEDIYVREEFRGKGIGKALFAHLSALTVKEGRVGIMFNVLKWNRPAIDFYRSLGATFLNDWKTICLEGNALRATALLGDL